MTPAALHRALASGDDQSARRAILACGDALRDSTADDPAALAALVLPLVTHASPVLRQALADVCDALPDDASAFDDVHARLLSDADPFVRAAAEAAGHRRAKVRRRTTKQKAEEKLVAGVLSDLEAQYPGARRLAERAVERGVEAFAAHLAHEVLKAQAPILRALAKLEADVDWPERSPVLLKDAIATVRERSQFAFSMVGRARDYAARAKPPVFKEQSLATIVGEARAQLADRLGARAGRLALVVDVDPALRAEVDGSLLLQALQNVLQNAAEAYDERAERLTVRVAAAVRRGGSEVAIAVSDDGGGIAEESRASLFVPFGSRKPGGTGLGLLIVRRAIEEVHGGELTIESAPKPTSGTTVTMILPMKQRRA